MAARFQTATPDLDSSADIFGATPDASPAVTSSRQTLYARSPTKRIPSDPTDSGISDSGTRSKSVTPEESHHRHRSPQVIYASDDEEESDEEAEEPEGEESQVEESAEENLTDDNDESVIRPRKSRQQVIESSDEEEEEGAVEVESDDEGHEVEAEVKGARNKIRPNQIISSDESEDETPTRQENKNPWNDSEEENSDDFISADEDEDEPEIVLTPPPTNYTNKPRILSPPQRSPTRQPVLHRGAAGSESPDVSVDDVDVSSSNRHRPSPPREQALLDQNIIDLSSDDDDDEVEVVETSGPGYQIPRPSGTVYKESDLNELETQIRKVKNSILANQHLLASSGARLPDGGKSLRATIIHDKARMERLRATLGTARQQLTSQLAGSIAQPPKMIKSLSGSSLPPIDNNPTSKQLEILKKKRTEIQTALKYSSRLSDGGEKMRDKLKQTNHSILELERQVYQEPSAAAARNVGINNAAAYSNQAWQAMREGNFVGQGQKDMANLLATGPGSTLYGGRMNDARWREVKTVTHDAIAKLHKSLETMPAEGDAEDQPRALKSAINLFDHQRQALAWMTWRELQSAPGGILADDMGLGKTLTMISLILKSREREDAMPDSNKENDWMSKKYGNLIKTQTTLIVAPASLLGQWENEVKTKVKTGHLRVMQYHTAAQRKATAKELARHDIIITTYGVILSEVKEALGDSFKEKKKLDEMGAEIDPEVGKGKTKLLSLAFQRIILDEAHTIRNPRSLQSQAICKLRAINRWCITGTPIQNKELDLYALIRFLRCDPFDEYKVWKTWVENKSVKGVERMNLIVKALILRRTKDQKSNITGKVLVSLPDKRTEIHEFELRKEEQKVYSQVENFAKGAMQRFMDQKGEAEERREMGFGGGGGGSRIGEDKAKSSANEFAFNPSSCPTEDTEGDVKVHHLLTLLLRLRQITCHPYLINGMIDQEARQSEGIEEDGEELDLISKLEDMNLSKEPETKAEILNIKNEVFNQEKPSSKIETVVRELRKLKDIAEETGSHEKAVVVSQWTSMLEIIKVHIKKEGLHMTEIHGQVPIQERTGIVEAFNRQNSGPQIMLLSLAAGGVGLNLVGANHLFLLDMHWNPQLESQACDRVYRVGQKREVTIHKFLVKGTVEERINALQQKKLKLADDVLSGAKNRSANKLTLEDMKTLFNVD